MAEMSGVLTILSSVLQRKKLEHLEVTSEPNMPFLYLLAVLGAMLKPKWTTSKSWPSLKVRAGAESGWCAVEPGQLRRALPPRACARHSVGV